MKDIRLVVIIVILCGIVACKKTPTVPEVPDIVVIEKEMLTVTLNASYIVFGQAGVQQNATGTVNYKSTSLEDSTDKTVNIGELVELGEVDKGSSKSFNITVMGDNALKRIYNKVSLSGTTVISGVTLLQDPQGFGIDDFVNDFLDQCSNRIRVWVPNTLTCYIDPNLPPDYITAQESVIREVVGFSQGTISAPVFFYERKPVETGIPADGEIWVAAWTELNGVTNANWPQGGYVVMSTRLTYNLNSSSAIRIRNETFDSFIKNNQNIFINKYIAKHFEFALKHRPKGNQNDYHIYTDREEQEGFDSGVSVMVYKSQR